MSQVASIIFMIVGVVLVASALITYLVFNRMEAKNSPDAVIQKVFKKKVSNPSAKLDLLHVILLGIMIVGLVFLLVGIIFGTRITA